MAFPPFHYSRSWQNPADYPTHQTSEEQNRADLQGSFTEWETYWNNTFLPALEAAIRSGGGSGGGSGGSDSGGPYLPLAGGTMTGPLRLYRLPLLAMEAAPKSYADSAAASAVADANGHIAQLELEAQRIAAVVADAMDREAVLELLADQITLSVTTRTDGDDVYARITLGIGENALYGEIKLDGNVTINGELSAEALYALYGEIANLAVNRLVTSRRIVKYLAGDTTDDNFVRIYGQFQEFVCASATGETEQARNPNGALLYWPMDVSGLPLGGDGYPLSNGQRVYTATTVTEYPVLVYSYAEAVKRSTHFELDEDGTTYTRAIPRVPTSPISSNAPPALTCSIPPPPEKSSGCGCAMTAMWTLPDCAARPGWISPTGKRGNSRNC